MVNFSLLIFLNFIIAEVSNSYSKVRERIDAQIYKERAKLISEAEDVIGESAKQDLIKFPRYIIARELEEWRSIPISLNYLKLLKKLRRL